MTLVNGGNLFFYPVLEQPVNIFDDVLGVPGFDFHFIKIIGECSCLHLKKVPVLVILFDWLLDFCNHDTFFVNKFLVAGGEGVYDFDHFVIKVNFCYFQELVTSYICKVVLDVELRSLFLCLLDVNAILMGYFIIQDLKL